MAVHEKPDDYERLRVAFTAVVSHELRTPLARLLAILETAALPGADPAEHLAQARAEVEEMRELVDDILFLSELETGAAAVALADTPVRPVVDDLVRELGESADRAAVDVRVDVTEDASVPLRPRMLRVVLENLVRNVLRYAGPHTTCTIGARDRELVVADDGAGVEAHELPRLFERFYRSDRARSSRGTGLGLAIVKHIATAAGGEVAAEPTPGGGLTVRVRFPRP